MLAELLTNTLIYMAVAYQSGMYHMDTLGMQNYLEAFLESKGIKTR